jgi:hypothetical protein
LSEGGRLMEDLGIDGSVREKNNKMNLKKMGFVVIY